MWYVCLQLLKPLTGRSIMDATKVLQGYGGTFVRLTVLPRGRYGAKNERTIILRRTHALKTNQKVAANTYEKCELPSSLAQCMVGNDRCHEFRNAATGDPVIHLSTIDIESIGLQAMSPDQSRFAVIGPTKDSRGIAIEVYELASQKRLAFIPLSSRSFSDIVFAPDNKSILVGGWDSIEIYDSTTGTAVSRKKLGYQQHRKVNGNQTIESVEEPVMSSVQPQRTVESPAENESPRQLVSKLAVSPGNLLALGESTGNIRIWDLATNKLLASIPGEQDQVVERLQFSPDGQWLAYYVGGMLHVERVSNLLQEKDDSDGPPQNITIGMHLKSRVLGILSK
jgi:WD40 repeat protein